MADDKDLEKEKAIAAAKAKAAAAAKAKAAALAKAQAQGQSSTDEPSPQAEQSTQTAESKASTETPADDLADAKAKAIAAAKAKAAAAAAAKAKALGLETAAPEAAGHADDAKAKAIAAAKAKAAAAAAAKAKALGQDAPTAGADDEKAKAIAAAKAKAAAAAAAKAKAAGGEGATATPAEEEKPSVNKPLLDLIVKKIQDHVGGDSIEQAYINFQGKEVPTLYIKKEKLLDVAHLLYNDADLDFKYLSNLHGIDFETHMEVYYYLQSYTKRHYVALHVKIDRDPAVLPSVTSIWYGANWQEREAYDLLGITFEGHPNMTRLFLPETWVGHPLRKDYVQYDEEV